MTHANRAAVFHLSLLQLNACWKSIFYAIWIEPVRGYACAGVARFYQLKQEQNKPERLAKTRQQAR
jgi:hypothetical protein